MKYLILFLTFFKIGAFTFGGGYAMLPLIQQEVAKHEWMSQQELIDFIAVSESTPGPFAVNAATYVGAKVAQIPGAICATLGVILPSFLIILIIAGCFEKFKESKYVKGIMSGLKPAVVGLIAAAILTIGKTVFMPDGISLELLKTPTTYLLLGIFAVSTVCALKKFHPIKIIAFSALAGIIGGFLI